MRRPSRLDLACPIVLSLLCLAGGACTPLLKEPALPEAELVPMSALPASSGELIAVTVASQKDGSTAWRELWFRNGATGQVTYVPVHLPDWKYYPKMVRTIDRTAWPLPAEVTP